MATDKQIECMKVDEKEVAGERVNIVETEFPPELSTFRSITASGVKYINKNFTFSGSQEKLSQP